MILIVTVTLEIDRKPVFKARISILFTSDSV